MVFQSLGFWTGHGAIKVSPEK